MSTESSQEGLGCLAADTPKPLPPPITDQTPPVFWPPSPGDGVGRPSYRFFPICLPQFSLELQLGVRQVRLNLSSAQCLRDLSDSLISLTLGVLICEMGMKKPT